MISHQDVLPWYKQPMVWMIIAIPLSAVLVCSILLYLAITTDDGLVADDYYKRGLAINRQIARDVVASDLQLEANIEIDARSGFIKTIFNKGKMEDFPAQITLVLRHATQHQQDQVATLRHGIDNQYVGSIPQSVHQGVWHLELSNAQGSKTKEWRMARRISLTDSTRVILQAE